MNLWILIPIIVGSLGFTFYMKHKAKSIMSASYGAFTLAQVSQRLGLRITAGAPDSNLCIPPNISGQKTAVSRGFADKTEVWHLRLDGLYQGREAVVEQYDERSVDEGLIVTTIGSKQNNHMSVRINSNIAFELTSRSVQPPLSRTLDLPQGALGDPALDNEFVFAANYSVGERVASALHGLDPNLRMCGVHLVSNGDGWLHALAPQATPTFYQSVESTLAVLADISTRLES